MLWCREGFSDFESVLEHLSACHWLSNTWYWCPQCSRPESFLGYKSSNEASFTSRSIQRKGSILRRAATFFRHFGRTAPAKSEFVWPESPPGTSEMADTALKGAELDGATSRHEIACCDQTHNAKINIELLTRLSHTVQHELPMPTNEKSTELLPYAKLPIHHSVMIQDKLLNSVKNSVYELPGGLIDHESLRGMPDDAENKSIQEDKISVSDTSANTTRSIAILHDPAPDPPISPVRSVHFENHDSPGTGFPQYRQNNSRQVQGRPKPICWLRQDRCKLWRAMIESARHVDGVASAEDQPIVDPFQGDHSTEHWRSRIPLGRAPSLNGDLTPMQRPIQELCEIVTIVHREWLVRLSSTPKVLAAYSKLSSGALCEIGLEALQKVFRGILIHSLLEIMALLNVALAASYILHGGDDLYYWNSFTLDMAQWRHTIAKESDAKLFVMVLERVTALSYNNELNTKPSHDGLFDALKHGQVVRVLSNFLDGKIISSFSFRTSHG